MSNKVIGIVGSSPTAYNTYLSKIRGYGHWGISTIGRSTKSVDMGVGK